MCDTSTKDIKNSTSITILNGQKVKSDINTKNHGECEKCLCLNTGSLCDEITTITLYQFREHENLT